MRIRRRSIAAVLGLMAGATVVLGSSSPAAAAATCLFDPVTTTVSVTMSPGSGVTTLSRTVPGAITVNGISCGTATVTNTDTIRATGAPQSAEQLVVDLRSGAFAPGVASEAGSPEIELFIDMGGSDGFDSVSIRAGEGDDSVAASASALDLDASDPVPDDDVVLLDARSVRVYGEGGNDKIDLGELITTSDNSPGTDRLVADSTALYGGAGDDSLSAGSASGCCPSLNSVLGDHAFGENESAVPAATGADTLRGEAGSATSLRGGLGNDVMFGGPVGRTLFVAEAVVDGSDVMNGGTGTDDIVGDTVSYQARSAALDISVDGLANDGDPAGIGEGDLVGSDIDRVLGGRGNDLLTAGAVGVDLNGVGGDDHIVGGGGNDTLEGYTGNDLLEGGGGNDSLRGGGVLVTNSGNDRLEGGDGDDTLDGDSGKDRLLGGAGNDVLRGGSQNDTLEGGTGDDDLSDTGGADYLGGDGGNDVLDGGAGNDDMHGSTGNDTLYGQGGGDTLVGGAGNDNLYGHAGADSFTARDGEVDAVDGGVDLNADVCVCDPDDTLTNIP